MQPGWGDAADNFWAKDMKHGTTELNVLAVVKPQTHMTTSTPSPTTFGELVQSPDIVPGQSVMPHVTSRRGSCHMRLGLKKPLAQTHNISIVQGSAWFISDGERNACWPHMLSPLHRVCQVNYHIEIGFGWRLGVGSSVAVVIDSEMWYFDVVRWRALK
jgi:hypothetical protein